MQIDGSKNCREGRVIRNGACGEKNGQQQRLSNGHVGYSWLRDDCLEFYRKELLLQKNSFNNDLLYSKDHSKTKRTAIQVKDRVGLLRLGINKAMEVKKRFPDAHFLEFGVHEGKDIVRMAAFLRSVEEGKRFSPKKSPNTNTKNKNSSNETSFTIFHGFDSFEGLPEDWTNGQFDADDKPFHKRGAFDTGGELPDVDDLVGQRLTLGNHGRTNRDNVRTKTSRGGPQSSGLSTSVKRVPNVVFHKGWFHESLPRFLDNHGGKPVAFVHADADLYNSTLIFLRLICEKRLFRRGSVIVFDEFWNYPNWENGEYKAWLNIVEEFGAEFKYEFFGYHAPQPTAKKFKQYGYQSVGVVITSDMNEASF